MGISSMEEVSVTYMPNQLDCGIDLPPGFRFHPSDEEIVTHYLYEKVKDASFSAIAIGQADMNKCEPWDLPKLARIGEKEWYFFCERDKKYPTGTRTNRATRSGYWKATGKDKEILKGKGVLVGMKKTLVFYMGRAPKGEKTNWVMHEYRLEAKTSYWKLPKSAKDEWVVCKVFHKNAAPKKINLDADLAAAFPMNIPEDPSVSCAGLPPLSESPYLTSDACNPTFVGEGSTTGLYKGLPPNSFHGNMAFSNPSLFCRPVQSSQNPMDMGIHCPRQRGDYMITGFGALPPHVHVANSVARQLVDQYSNQSGISGSPQTSGVSVRPETEIVDGQISSDPSPTMVDLDNLLCKYS